MNNLTVFNNEEFGNLRSSDINNEPWFVGRDVAEALGYERTDNAIRSHVDDEDKLMHQISASGQNRNMYIVNESGLYSLILSSKLPNAKKFKRWVTSEVLPSLRKTGFYSFNNIKGLSENTQLVIAIGNSLAEQERRINQVEKKVDDTVGDLKTIIEAIKSEANWRQGINNKIGQIVAAKGSTWEVEYPLLYRELETRARCDLAARKRNWIRRMLERGSTKTKANKTRKIDVIEDDPKLKEIFSKIVAENIIMYCI